MIRSYFHVVHITTKKIIIGSTQPAHDVLGMSPEGSLKCPNVWDLRWTFSRLSVDQYKNWWFYEKIVFQK